MSEAIARSYAVMNGSHRPGRWLAAMWQTWVSSHAGLTSIFVIQMGKSCMFSR
jgi:hypothetical protein